MNTQISKNSAVFLAAVLVAGTISMIVPSSFAQEYYPQDPYAQDPYAQDPYAKDHKKSASVNVQKIKCVNENLNVNGIQISTLPETGVAAAQAQAEDAGATNGNGLLGGDGINFNKNLVNVCVNVNVNDQVDVNDDDNGPFPPPSTCDDCFKTPDEGGPIPQMRLADLNDYLANNEVTVGGTLQNVENVQGLCDAIEEASSSMTPATQDEIEMILANAFADVPGNQQPLIDRVIECLLSIPDLIEPDAE